MSRPTRPPSHPLALASALVALAGPAFAADLSIVSGPVGRDNEVLRMNLDKFEEQTGHSVEIVEMPSSTTDQFAQYRLWLSAGNSDIDVYRTDVVWAPQLASHFTDLSAAAEGQADKHFESIIQSQTVDGKLVAMPMFSDAPALYYRTDLMEKYGFEPPETWEEMAEQARAIQDGERGEGADDFHGFVFQGAAYEGLTCDALEWVMSHGGGQIVEPDGTISIDNPEAAKALDTAASWIGTISPEGVLAYKEEESRGVWQTGNAAFMRNWPYAWALGQGEDSAVADKFAIAPLPSGGAGSAATLGGWNLAVSKYSDEQEAAIELVMFLTGEEAQKTRAIELTRLPTIEALYDDPEIAEAQPSIPQWKEIFLNTVPRPSAPTQGAYNEVSNEFWDAVHATLSGDRPAEASLKRLSAKLERIKGSGW
ncbi:ABC transporter substrate-binding protein [uncultured Albimonas sp.]|uniref:ABC transporter substrate-binding protein n=1 Tax=uncultured Albimonas sp. TaxID=1331701 RepID=UPI0030EECAAC